MLSRGSRGQSVSNWQRWLNTKGFNAGVPDGIFGVKTERAVRWFQRLAGVTVDGKIGPVTENARRHYTSPIKKIVRQKLIEPIRSKFPRKVSFIVLHYSYSPFGNARIIDEWHRSRGFKMIGYHAVVLLNGALETGRPAEMVGAHTKWNNVNSYGIVYIGMSHPNPAQYKTLQSITHEVQYRFHIPTHKVYGHRELRPTLCPGDLNMGDFRVSLPSVGI